MNSHRNLSKSQTSPENLGIAVSLVSCDSTKLPFCPLPPVPIIRTLNSSGEGDFGAKIDAFSSSNAKALSPGGALVVVVLFAPFFATLNSRSSPFSKGSLLVNESPPLRRLFRERGGGRGLWGCHWHTYRSTGHCKSKRKGWLPQSLPLLRVLHVFQF